jgi:uncharacterized protein with GYD domain
MVRYLALVTFTDQGVRNVAQSIDRAGQFRAAVESAGGRVLSQYWTLGELDGCFVFEAPDETTAAGLLLRLDQGDNIRTRTLRAFDSDEFQKIIGSLD